MGKFSSSGGAIPGNSIPTKKQEIPSIEHVQLKAGQKQEDTLSSTLILFVTQGEFFLSYDHILNLKVTTGKILLLPPGCHFTAWAQINASVLVFRINEAIHFCGEYSINSIRPNKDKAESNLNCLYVNPAMANFMSSLIDNIESGLKHEKYLKLKAEELLYMIKSYYTKKEIEYFFLPLLASDVQFHQFVLRYYRKVKTVREFAGLKNCSVSNFDKKFRMVFGTSAYQWMQQKKIDLLYHEINATDKPLRQIAKEQKFLSLPQFNDYCKKHLGFPPGKMRKMSTMFSVETNYL